MIKLFNFKKMVAFFLALVLLVPAVSFGQLSEEWVKTVYFEDTQGRLVAVNYEEATRSALDGDSTLYDGLRSYVGDAERNMRRVLIETNSGNVFDYQKALTANQGILSEIISNEDFRYSGPVEYAYELIVRGDDVVIDDVNRVELESIRPVSGIEVAFGTSKSRAISNLSRTTVLVDQRGEEHTVSLNWTISDYERENPGSYVATATFNLPSGMINPKGLELKVRTTVLVLEQEEETLPAEVSEVFIITSELTGHSYANIHIKSEFVSDVTGVTVEGNEAVQNTAQLDQWRVPVATGTAIEDLFGLIVVSRNVDDEQPVNPDEISFDWEVREASAFLPMIKHVRIFNLQGLDAATHYEVTYQLSGGDQSTCTRVKIGEETEGIFFNGVLSETVEVHFYNADGTLLYSEFVKL